jgi:hypothetical protein
LWREERGLPNQRAPGSRSSGFSKRHQPARMQVFSKTPSSSDLAAPSTYVEFSPTKARRTHDRGSAPSQRFSRRGIRGGSCGDTPTPAGGSRGRGSARVPQRPTRADDQRRKVACVPAIPRRQSTRPSGDLGASEGRGRARRLGLNRARWIVARRPAVGAWCAFVEPPMSQCQPAPASAGVPSIPLLRR